MIEIIALLSCFDQTLPGTSQRQLAIIITAMLRMTGRVTMLGISRWTDKGGSYRTNTFANFGDRYCGQARPAA